MPARGQNRQRAGRTEPTSSSPALALLPRKLGGVQPTSPRAALAAHALSGVVIVDVTLRAFFRLRRSVKAECKQCHDQKRQNRSGHWFLIVLGKYQPVSSDSEAAWLRATKSTKRETSPMATRPRLCACHYRAPRSMETGISEGGRQSLSVQACAVRLVCTSSVLANEPPGNFAEMVTLPS